MKRRDFLAVLAAGSAGAIPRRGTAPAPLPAGPLERTAMGVAVDSFQFSKRPKSADAFLEYCASLGAGGVQARLPASFDADYIRRLRQHAEERGMYLEISLGLPGEDPSEFERGVRAASEAGAVALRSACLSGRRYEVFTRLDDWTRFVADSKTKIARALPILEKYRMRLGIENHKDWTTEELVALMKEFGSEYLGVCIDTGNNIALLDDPMEVVRHLAPYAMNTHFKDMAVEESEDGFLLAEVRLGEGALDLRGIVETVLRARPETKITLEMITRNPLHVPCLTEKYWATFPDRPAPDLARLLRWVRANKPRHPLARPDELDDDARRRLEEGNVRRSLAYARERLGL